MPLKYTLAILFLLLCSACSSVSVSPVSTATGTINIEDKSITEIRSNVAFTVKLDELSVAPYQEIDNIASFYVEIDNRTEEQVSFPPQVFLLKDGNNRQYRSVTPERVREIVSKDTVYLIPYPYVGYYYLEDQALAAHNESFSSSMPFYAEYHPQDIFTRALTQEPIVKKSKASGVVYFIADLERSNYAELLLYPDTSLSGEPIAKFPFAIEK
jgi:hypothetical protein